MVREAHIDYHQVNLSSTERLQRLLGAVILLIRGEIDNTVFEEECHQLVGAGGYVLYTVDKVVISCLKHLHTAFSEPLCNDLLVLLTFFYHQLGLLCTLLTAERSDYSEWLSKSGFAYSPELSPSHFSYRFCEPVFSTVVYGKCTRDSTYSRPVCGY